MTARPTLPAALVGDGDPVPCVDGVDRPYLNLDAGASTAALPAVAQRVNDFLPTYSSVHRGAGYRSREATTAYELARRSALTFAGRDPEGDDIAILCRNTTEAINHLAYRLRLAPDDVVVTTVVEHHANLVPWQHAARMSGAELVVLRPDAQGRLHEGNLAALLSPRTRVLALTAGANATGERPPYEAMLAMARQVGALTVLDAAQAVGHAAPALATLECDFMAFSGHKMYGPMGIGVLAGRRDALERLYPLRLGGDMVEDVSYERAVYAALPARLEGGTPNVAGAVGLAAAARFIEQVGRAAIDQHVHALRARAAAGLAALPGVTVLAPHATQAALVSFVAEDVHPHDIGTLLDERGIAVRTGHHCAQPLHDHFGLGPTTRASFALYNTPDEVERLVAGVARALETMR